MALAVRLLGRRRLLPPHLAAAAAAAAAHLSAAPESPSFRHHHHQQQLPRSASPTLPLPPFAAPARSFSWYSRSGPGPSSGTAATEALDDHAHTEFKSVYSGGVRIFDDEEGAACVAGAAADAAGEAAAATGVDGVSDLAISTVVNLIDGLHSLTGLPWWITISLSTVAMRLLVLPVLIVQMKKAAKIGEIFRKLPPPLPPSQSGRSYHEQYTLFRKKKKELGCPSFLWNFAYFSVQFPCFILWMVSIRSMCLNNHPGFDNGGILWFHNLSEFSHGSFGLIFPVLVAGLHYLNVQISFHGSQIRHHPGIFGLLAKYYKAYLDILTIPLFLAGYVVPQGSLIYWATNGLFSAAQQLSLRNDAVCKMLGLPDTRSLYVNAAQKSLQGPKLQGSPYEDADIQTKWASSISGTSIESTSPNFILEEGSNIIEGNVSESSSPEELLEQALQYLGNSRLDQAIPLIRTAVEKNPDLSTALIGMGQTLFSNRLFPEAAECFEHAIPKIQENDPLLVLAHFGAGISRERQGENEMAIKILQRLAELKEPEKPINKTCYFQGVLLLGSVLYREGRKSEATKYVRMAAAYDPSAERFLKECEEAIEDEPKSAKK